MKPNLYRFALAYLAAAASVLMCGLRGHVQIEALHPATYLSAFHHRCGLVMVACCTWAALEMLLVAATPTHRHQRVLR